MLKLSYRLRESRHCLSLLLVALFLSASLLFLASCSSAPIPLTVTKIKLEKIAPPEILLNPSCVDPQLPDLKAADWDTQIIGYLLALLEENACLKAAVSGIKDWVNGS